MPPITDPKQQMETLSKNFNSLRGLIEDIGQAVDATDKMSVKLKKRIRSIEETQEEVVKDITRILEHLGI